MRGEWLAMAANGPDVLRCPQMTGHGAKFGRKKEDAIAALLTHRTVEEAARSLNIATKTLLRWMKEPEFDAAYRAAKRAAFGQSIARLHHLSSAAVSTLGKIMLDSATPPSTRVRAADSILDHTTKAIEIEDIDARLRELEANKATAGEDDASSTAREEAGRDSHRPGGHGAAQAEVARILGPAMSPLSDRAGSKGDLAQFDSGETLSKAMVWADPRSQVRFSFSIRLNS